MPDLNELRPWTLYLAFTRIARTQDEVRADAEWDIRNGRLPTEAEIVAIAPGKLEATKC